MFGSLSKEANLATTTNRALSNLPSVDSRFGQTHASNSLAGGYERNANQQQQDK
jgi:hypothetical protein